MKSGYSRASLIAIVGSFALAVTACNAVTGTYTGGNGSISLELKSNGAAAFTVMGQATDCTWAQEANQIRVTCEGETTVFTRGKDGSLAGPPGSLFEPLKKK
jgi:hypothetical protein